MWEWIRRRSELARSSRRTSHRDSGSRIGLLETLETRTLLSGTHPRIVNGEEIDDRHPRIVNGTPTSTFPTVGLVGDRSGSFCTGTLIGPSHVLTAAHCAEGVHGTNGRFTVAGRSHSTVQVFVHPEYNRNRIGDDRANDIAIYQLSAAVSDVTPSPLYRNSPRVGDMLTLVGYGAGGSGSGHDGSFGTKRVGTTPIDAISPRLIHWTFDNNSESNTAPGDSGGPAFLAVGSVYYVAGVTSGGSRANAGIGDRSFDTRVDFYTTWIDSIVGSTGPSNPPPNPNPGPPQAGDDHADAVGSSATALTIQGGSFSGTGTIETAGDRDFFQITLQARGALNLELSRLTASLDTYLRVYDGAGNLIALDDDSGPETDSRLSVIVAPGTWYISAGSYNDVGTGAYRLDGTFMVDDHSDFASGATPMSLDSGAEVTTSGAIGHAGDRDIFQVVASRRGHVRIDLRANGSGVDPVLTVYDSRGRAIGVNDDYGGSLDSRLVLRLKAGATYYVQAAGYQTTQGTYALTFTPSQTGRQRAMALRDSRIPAAAPESNKLTSGKVDLEGSSLKVVRSGPSTWHRAEYWAERYAESIRGVQHQSVPKLEILDQVLALKST